MLYSLMFLDVNALSDIEMFHSGFIVILLLVWGIQPCTSVD